MRGRGVATEGSAVRGRSGSLQVPGPLSKCMLGPGNDCTTGRG